ncbi:MAG: hypothetical protein CO189_11610 [candidate division Zixibacteria bacterium CG_4_9_14_3_um_filter_46_8]|nr:MAG: hypothetical protein CO189_11610 [candidate division Zixibacteria bacterium CG_4_9_14_3_um_filter_46_8]
MNFPVWELGFAPGLLMAVVATLHVFVSHFAIGTGLFLVITERKAYREDDAELLSYLKRHSLVFIMVSVVFGAVSGVGIWFVIGLINPAVTSSLIHAFVFGWAIEWVFFIVEILAGLIYYYGWDKLRRDTHLTIGWIYFIAAFLSLVVINGIVTFMLTPAGWLENREFWTGFFNPTYFPSLVSRTFLSLALAGIYALVTASFIKETGVHRRITRYAGIWIVANMVLFELSLLWYWKAMPETVYQAAAGAIPITVNMLDARLTLSAITVIIALFTALIVPKLNKIPVAVAIMVLALGVFGSSEWIRESVRKPYSISQYIYTNGIFPSEVGAINEKGILASAKWISDEARHGDNYLQSGYEIFRVECMSCHTENGYLGIADKIKGWEKEFIFEITARLDSLRGKMPPFAGTEADRRMLTEYLSTLAGASRSFADGKEVFEDRCGICHTVGQYRNIIPMVADFTYEDLNDAVLAGLQDMNGNMPPFTGNADAREKLAKYLASLKDAKRTK